MKFWCFLFLGVIVRNARIVDASDVASKAESVKQDEPKVRDSQNHLSNAVVREDVNGPYDAGVYVEEGKRAHGTGRLVQAFNMIKRKKRQTTGTFGCTNSFISDYFRQLATDLHNQLRKSLAEGDEPNKCGLLGSGSNVYKLEYDCGLENSAYKWASNCTYGYSPNNINRGAGENILYIYTSSSDLEVGLITAIQKWWDQARAQGIPSTNMFSTNYSSWAQMASGENNAIGCAAVQCPDLNQNGVYVVCHYEHYASIMGSTVYNQGTPCKTDQDCSAHLSSSCIAEEGLCLAPEPAGEPSQNTICPDNPNMDDAARQTVLDWHNFLRSRVIHGLEVDKNGKPSPTGKNMYKMIYDCTLEKQAQSWANGCLFQHSSPSSRNNSGENLFQASSGIQEDRVKMMEAASKSWWSELKTIGISNSDNMFTDLEVSSGVGHYTQMAWGKSYRVGCGVAKCSGMSNAGYVVCQYAPAGNYRNQVIYELGSPCEKDADCTTNPGDACSVDDGLCVRATSA